MEEHQLNTVVKFNVKNTHNSILLQTRKASKTQQYAVRGGGGGGKGLDQISIAIALVTRQ